MILGCFSQCVQCRKGNGTLIHWEVQSLRCACGTRALALAISVCGQICCPAVPGWGVVNPEYTASGQPWTIMALYIRKHFWKFRTLPKTLASIQTQKQQEGFKGFLGCLNLNHITIHYCLCSPRSRKGWFRKCCL